MLKNHWNLKDQSSNGESNSVHYWLLTNSCWPIFALAFSSNLICGILILLYLFDDALIGFCQETGKEKGQEQGVVPRRCSCFDSDEFPDLSDSKVSVSSCSSGAGNCQDQVEGD